MKKSKNLLLSIALVMSMFLFVGVAKAEAPWSFNKAWLVCNPEALQPGESADCYYFGEVTGAYTTPNAGFYTRMYTTDNLTIVSVKANEKLNKVGAKYVDSSSTNDQGIGGLAEKMPSTLSNFKCNVKAGDGIDTNSRGCGVFYTEAGQTPAYALGDMKVYGSLKEKDLTNASMNVSKTAVLGHVTVQLSDDNNVDKCGNLCIASFAIRAEADWAYGDCTSGAMTSSWNGAACSSVSGDFAGSSTPSHLPDGEYDCFEIPLKSIVPHQNTETGSFVSYAILAAAALIAISAVTISKKHNRLQKI